MILRTIKTPIPTAISRQPNQRRKRCTFQRERCTSCSSVGKFNPFLDRRQTFPVNHDPAVMLHPLPESHVTGQDTYKRHEFHRMFSFRPVYTRGQSRRLQHTQNFCCNPVWCSGVLRDRMDQDIRQLLSQRQKDRAFEVLLQRYQAKVFRLVYSIVGNSSRAEEVTQDSFLKIWQALPGYDGRASLSTWIYTIARNTSISHLRSEFYRKTLTLEEAPEPFAEAEPVLSRIEIERLVGEPSR